MNTRTATPAILAVSLAVLLSGAAAVSADADTTRVDLAPAGNATVIGLVRGKVMVREDFSPIRDDVSPLRTVLPSLSIGSISVTAPTPATETVDDDLSPLRGSR